MNLGLPAAYVVREKIINEYVDKVKFEIAY